MGRLNIELETLAGSLNNIGNYLETLPTAIGLVMDPISDYKEKLEIIRNSQTYQLPYSEKNPLVTIRVSTYKGLNLLKERCIPSILSQSYKNWELIVVGDNDPEPSEEYVNSLKDSRIRYIQRPYRGPYPGNPRQDWLISGAHGFNVATREANGLWLTKLDQDDSWEPNFLEDSLRFAKVNQPEILYGMTRVFYNRNLYRPPTELGEYPPKKGSFALTTALVHGDFKVFEMNEISYLWNEPGDWGLTWRLWLAGAKFEYRDEIFANVFITPKSNHDYYESQYRILLSMVQNSKSHLFIRIIKYPFKKLAILKIIIYKILNYLKAY